LTEKAPRREVVSVQGPLTRAMTFQREVARLDPIDVAAPARPIAAIGFTLAAVTSTS